jgi:hypothetical protein
MTETTLSPGLLGKSAANRSASEKRFFLVFAVVMALIIFAGFAPSYYLKSILHAPPPLSAMSRLHGVVFTAWVLLFVTQAALIDAGNPALHRRLGLMGAVLLGAVLAIGVMTAVYAARLGHAPPGAPPQPVFLAVPLMGIVATAILFLAALWNRAQRDVHMRYMLAGFMTMTPPATARSAIGAGLAPESIPLCFAIMNVLLVVAVLWDMRALKRVHPVWLWSGALFLGVEAAIWWAFKSPAWIPFANWLIQG